MCWMKTNRLVASIATHNRTTNSPKFPCVITKQDAVCGLPETMSHQHCVQHISTCATNSTFMAHKTAAMKEQSPCSRAFGSEGSNNPCKKKCTLEVALTGCVYKWRVSVEQSGVRQTLYTWYDNLSGSPEEKLLLDVPALFGQRDSNGASAMKKNAPPPPDVFNIEKYPTNLSDIWHVRALDRFHSITLSL